MYIRISERCRRLASPYPFGGPRRSETGFGDHASVTPAAQPSTALSRPWPCDAAAVGGCYGAERGALFSVFQGNPFTFIMPPGWHVGPEGQDYMELENSGNTASATYELWGPFVQGVNVSQPLNTPAQAISFWFGKFGFQGVHLLSAITAAADLEYSEFTATLSGKAVHGLIYMNISTSGQTTAGVFRLALAAAGLWNPVNGALIQMVGSIQHNFSQDLKEIQAVNRQWQDFSGQIANFDDTLNNQQLVQDPTTGKFYEAPYSSYITDGPGGPATTYPMTSASTPWSAPDRRCPRLPASRTGGENVFGCRGPAIDNLSQRQRVKAFRTWRVLRAFIPPWVPHLLYDPRLDLIPKLDHIHEQGHFSGAAVVDGLGRLATKLVSTSRALHFKPTDFRV